MKHLIIIIAMTAGLAHGQPVDLDSYGLPRVGNFTNVIKVVGKSSIETTHPIYIVNEPVLDDKAIKRAIENGDVCRVRGKHEWEFIIESKEGLIISYDNTRKCTICGRKETKQEVWKEEKQ